MKIIKTAPVICESCEKVFQAKYAFLCPRCLKKLRSDTAKKTGLNKIGNKAYSGTAKEITPCRNSEN